MLTLTLASTSPSTAASATWGTGRRIGSASSASYLAQQQYFYNSYITYYNSYTTYNSVISLLSMKMLQLLRDFIRV
jgi:hypothetical protein